MYIYISIHTYYTWTRALTRLETGRQVALKECAEKVRWLGTELELERNATVTVSNDFVWRLPGAHHPTFWVPTAHLRFLVWRFKRLAFGPGRIFPRSQEKKDHDLWSQKWWEMVPDIHLQKSHGPMSGEKWSNIYLNVDTNPPIYRPGRSIMVDIDGR